MRYKVKHSICVHTLHWKIYSNQIYTQENVSTTRKVATTCRSKSFFMIKYSTTHAGSTKQKYKKFAVAMISGAFFSSLFFIFNATECDCLYYEIKNYLEGFWVH